MAATVKNKIDVFMLEFYKEEDQASKVQNALP